MMFLKHMFLNELYYVLKNTRRQAHLGKIKKN